MKEVRRMGNRVPAAEHKNWDSPATMEDVFEYYQQGLKFYGRAWRRAKLATWIAIFSFIMSIASMICILIILL